MASRLRWALSLAALMVAAPAWSQTPGQGHPPVVAEGDGVVVTWEDLMKRARVLATLLRVPPDHPGADAYLLDLAARTVQHLANLVLLETYAAWDGTSPDPSEVDRRLSLAERRMGGRAALESALRAWGLAVDDLRRELAREALWDAYLDRFAREAVILEEFAERFWRDNRQLYRVPDRYALHGVVFRSRRPAEAFRAAVLRGVDFLVLARRVVAQGWLQAQGGDVGWLEDTRMHPWVLQAARALRPGEISPTFGGPFGWYVVRLVDARPGRLLTYAEARPRVLEELRRSSARTDLYILVGRLRRDLRVRFWWPPRLMPGVGRRVLDAPQGEPPGSWGGLPTWSRTSGHLSGGG